MGLWGLNEHYRWQTLGKVLIASCVIALPAYMAFMTALFYHPEWVPYFNLPEPWIQHEEWWTFFAENISHFKHRLFLCSVELFGAIIAFRLYYKRPAVLLPLWAVMLSSIPLTGSRQAILSAVALFFVGILCSLPAVRRRRYGAALVLLGVVLGAGLLHLHPRMQEFELSDIKEMRELSYYHDIRLNIWGAALQHPEEYLAHGLGAGQSSNYLREKYRAAGFDHYVYMCYHPHNQYLEELMEIGLPGLLLFLLAKNGLMPGAMPKGAFYMLLDIRPYLGKQLNGETVENDADFAAMLLEHGHVAVIPGTPFGASGFVRLSYAVNDIQIGEAIRRITAFVRSLQ